MKKAELINQVLLAGLSLIFGAWTFLAYGPEEADLRKFWEGNLNFNQEITASEKVFISAEGRDSLTLMPGAVASVSYDETNQKLNVDLKDGEVLFAALAGDFSVTVSTAFMRVDSHESEGYISFDKEKNSAEVYSVLHPSTVTFLTNGNALNAISVPSGNYIKVPASKVTDKLSKLLLTKLVKEFQFFEFKNQDLSEGIQAELAAITDEYAKYSTDYLVELSKNRESGPLLSGLGSNFYAIFYKVREILTILPHAEENLLGKKRETALLYSMSNGYDGNSEREKFWLDVWQSYDTDMEEIKNLRADLFFVLPGDNLYQVKSAADTLSTDFEDFFANLVRRYNEIEDLILEAKETEASGAYLAYKTLFESGLASGAFNDSTKLAEWGRQYLLIEILLRKNSIFYDKESVELLSKLEEKILSLSSGDQNLNEEKQAFVQSKIRFLENLFDFVLERKISIEKATELANQLILESQDYLNSINTEVAVSSYFKQKLVDFELAVQFMNSAEFRSYNNFEEGLAAFKAKLEDLVKLNEYIQKIREGTAVLESSIPLDEAMKTAMLDLNKNGVLFKEIKSLGDSSNRLFEIVGGKISTYSFEANYDRETKILYDISLGSIRFNTGIALESFKNTVLQAVKTEDYESESEEENTIQESSLTESVALDYAKSQFKKIGLDTEKFKIILVDLDKNLFSFEGYVTEQKIKVYGTFDANSLKVSEITWDFNGEINTLPDMDLKELENAVDASYKALSE